MSEKTYKYCEIVSNERIASDVFDMVIKSEEISKSAVPGQFAGIYTDMGEMILPRPISICGVDSQAGTVRFVYRVVGNGTEAFSRMKPGESLRILASLGNGYTIFPEHKRVVVVGGGIGIPPMLLLAEKAVKNAEVTAILGFRDETFLVDDFNKLGLKTHIATDDGSVGFKGNTVQLLDSLDEKFDVIYGCGPKIMLKFLAQWAEKHDVPCYISLEERMGCGFGACVGCVCSVSDDIGNKIHKKVCVDGPIFNAREVVFD